MSMANYKDAGVNIEEGYRTVDLIKGHAARTMIPGVINNLGSFGGMFELGKYQNPVLVSGTDGVGTKLEIAFKTKKYDTVGIDCVAMCVNDILCHGAKPLFFLDYLACGKLEAQVAADLVKGVSEGCVQSGCALIGGETAEMPGFYQPGEYDIAGFAVGVVEKDNIIDGSRVKAGDVLIGLRSSGLHSNGYSLVRKLIPDIFVDFHGEPIWKTLLEPTRIYVKPVLALLERFDIHGMAHITGGGFFENIPRMWKGELTAVIEKSRLVIPDIFHYMISLGVEEEHMFNTYNMGTGMVLSVEAAIAEDVIKTLAQMGVEASVIGTMEAGGDGVCIK